MFGHYYHRYRKGHIRNRLVRRVQPILVSGPVFVNDAHKNGCDSAHIGKQDHSIRGANFNLRDIFVGSLNPLFRIDSTPHTLARDPP